jgi:TonB family protein
VLWVAREDSITIEARVFEAACASSSSRIRDYAWWHVAVFLAENQPITTLVREWLSKEAAGGGGDPILSFGRELAARALSYTPMENDGLIARLGKESDDPPLPAPFWGFLEGPLFRFLTAAEQNAVNSRRPEPQHRTAKEALVVPPRDKSYGTYRTMRTVSNLPYGLALDLAQQMGCKPGDKEEVAGAVVRYDEARVLRAIEYIETTLEKPCAPTARYLSWISATPPPIEMIPEQKEIMLLPMHKTFLTCLDGPPPSNAAPATGPIPLRSAGIVAPRKTKMVNPIYPASAQMARRQGFVVIEATISPAGCVTRGEVRHSIAPDLDVSAMRAVTGWKFTPTLVDGKPMPVVMTVTVQFMLR